MDKQCKECGASFSTNFSKKVYCSEFCKVNEHVSCEYCNKDFYRQRNKNAKPYCSKKCRNIHTGKTLLINCDFCGSTYYKAKVFYERSEKHFCSEKCQHQHLVNKEEVVCKTCGETFECIPSRKEEKTYCSMRCKKGYIPKDDLIYYYVHQRLSAESTGSMLGVSESLVFRFLKEYKIPVRHAGNNDWIKSNDGHLVRSSYERIFDDKLFENNIEHEYDPKLPFNKRYMADFKINDIYVEIWGIVGSEQYDKRRKIKQSLYRENDIILVDVFPEDFKDIDKKIEEIKRLIS